MSTVKSSLNFYREDSPDAETMIVDAFNDNGNPLIFCVNVLLSAVRLMLPVELLLKGFKIRYFIMMIYQFIITANYLKNAANILRKKADETQKAAFCVFTGFLLVSTMFEADFGSWTRHEAAIVLIMFALFFKPKEKHSLGQTFILEGKSDG
jgi:hypothetical protein